MTANDVTAKVQVPVEPARAFEIFTDEIDRWWPKANTFGEQDAQEVVIEREVRGRWYERATDGTVTLWGEVVAVEPGRCLVLTWAISPDQVPWKPEPDPARASTIKVRFEPSANGSWVVLVHRDIGRHGARAEDMAAAMASSQGWPNLLNLYAQACEYAPNMYTITDLPDGVPVSALWTLHNRAVEAARPDGVLKDPLAIDIHRRLDVPFERLFGPGDGSHAARSAAADAIIARWLAVYPEGTVVGLGDGLETQAQRLDNGSVRWLSVDLPSSIRLRERFIQPTDRFWHHPGDALDLDWLSAVDPRKGVFVVALGLLMYLEPDLLPAFVDRLGAHFPGGELVFDTIPRWFSRKTLKGLKRTSHYQVPPMPWGIDRQEIALTMHRWSSSVAAVSVMSYDVVLRGPLRPVVKAALYVPFLKNKMPSLVHLSFNP